MMCAVWCVLVLGIISVRQHKGIRLTFTHKHTDTSVSLQTHTHTIVRFCRRMHRGALTRSLALSPTHALSPSLHS